MSVVVPRPSTLLFEDAVVAALLEGGELCLFKNNYTPIATTVLANLTEANFDGYARITLTGWPAASLDANNKASSALAAQFFTMTAPATTPNDIYGIYVLSPTGALLFAERNPAGPVTMNTDGQTYSYLPRSTGKSEF